MIEKESSSPHRLPPGFDSGQWPPLIGAGEAGNREILARKRRESQGQPDLSISGGCLPLITQESPSLVDSGISCPAPIPLVETAPQPPIELYKAKLLTKGAGDMEIESEGEWELEEEDVTVDRSELVPKVAFSSRTHERLAANMNSTVIIRLMGRNIGYKSLQFQIKRLWKPISIFNLVELGNNWFMVKFESQDDYMKSLTQGPWVVFGVYLIVQPWTPSFHPESTVISSIVAWIRFPNLPIHYYHSGVLKSIADVVGKVYKVDRNTSSFERGKYARFAVGLDLSRPLLPHITIDGKDQRVEYEGLPQICFNCGTYGHVIQNCPKLRKAQSQVSPSAQPITQGSRDGKGSEAIPEEPSHQYIEKSGYGPGMLAERRVRKPGVVRQAHPDKSTCLSPKKNSGSRFDILSVDDDMIMEVETTNNRVDGTNALTDTTLGGSCEGEERANSIVGKNNDKGKKSAIVEKEDKLKKSARDPLVSITQNKRVLDPSKHSVSIILDDKIHYGMPEPVYSFPYTGPTLDKENSKRHGPNRGRPKGILLAQNVQKSLKVKKAKTSSSSPPGNSVKTARLESIGSEISIPVG